MTFDDAFILLIGNEGGYVNDPKDPGGETKYGISKRAYPSIRIASLTIDEAKTIYKKDYWIPAGCESVPDELRFDLFDMAVNSGVKQAIKTLQKSCGANVDGILGPKTLMIINSFNPYKLKVKLNCERLLFFTELSNWNSFGKGWAKRIANNLLNS